MNDLLSASVVQGNQTKTNSFAKFEISVPFPFWDSQQAPFLLSQALSNTMKAPHALVPRRLWVARPGQRPLGCNQYLYRLMYPSMALSVSSTLYSPLICTSLLFGIPATVLNFAVGSMDRLEVERHFYVGSACQAIFDTLNGFSNTNFRGIRKNRIWKTLKKVEVLVSQSVPGQCWGTR